MEELYRRRDREGLKGKLVNFFGSHTPRQVLSVNFKAPCYYEGAEDSLSYYIYEFVAKNPNLSREPPLQTIGFELGVICNKNYLEPVRTLSVFNTRDTKLLADIQTRIRADELRAKSGVFESSAEYHSFNERINELLFSIDLYADTFKEFTLQK